MSKQFPESVEQAAASIVRSLERADSLEEPFPILLLDEILPPDLFESLTDPDWSPDKEISHRRVWLLDRNHIKEPWLTVRDAFCHGVVKYGLARYLHAGGYAEPRICHDLPGYELVTHADISSKNATMTVSLNRETNLSQPYGLRLHTAQDKPAVVTTSFLPNTGYAFRRTEQSWHSVRKVRSGVRKTLLVPFFARNRRPWRV